MTQKVMYPIYYKEECTRHGQYVTASESIRLSSMNIPNSKPTYIIECMTYYYIYY